MIFKTQSLHVLLITTFFLFFNVAPADANTLGKSDKKSKPIKILVLGDSLTEGYGVAKKDAYPAQLETLLSEKLKDKTTKVINAGSSGSTSASAKGRIQWHLRAKPKLVIFSLGANDGLRGLKIDSTRKNLETAIKIAQKSQVKIILSGMMLPHNYGKKYRTEFENLFKELSKKHNVALVPFLLKDVGAQKEMNLPDGIHPNEKGHKKIAETLLPYVLKEIQ